MVSKYNLRITYVVNMQIIFPWLIYSHEKLIMLELSRIIGAFITTNYSINYVHHISEEKQLHGDMAIHQINLLARPAGSSVQKIFYEVLNVIHECVKYTYNKC